MIVSRSQKRNSSHEFTRFLGINAYPSTLFFDSQMNYISPVKGYLNPKQIEIYLHLFKDDKYKNIKSQEDFDGLLKLLKVELKFNLFFISFFNINVQSFRHGRNFWSRR